MRDGACRLAAERAANERAKIAVLQALGYDEYLERPVPPFGEQLDDLFFYDVVPFFIWVIKASFLAFALLLGSVGTYAATWGLMMRGQEVKHRPIFFDYSPGESMMPTGVVDLRSTKSAPWVHSESEIFHPTEDVCSNNANQISYCSGEENNCSGKVNDQTSIANGILASGERYFFEVTLTLPESEINKELGIFMVRVDMRSVDRSLLASSKQHSMLPYESAIVSLFRKIMLIVPLASGFISETRTISLLCFDNYADMNVKKPLSLVEVSLGVPNPAAFPATKQTLQIHSAELRYGKEMNPIQRFFRNWHYSCAVFGITFIFVGFVLIALTILNYQARKKILITQPYADFFDSDDESALISNSESHDIWMGADIEILREEGEEDSNAWEPIDSQEKKVSKESTNVINNFVSDDESSSRKHNMSVKPQNLQGRGNANRTFPLGTLGNNSTVMGHEHPLVTNPNGEGTEHGNGSSDEANTGKNDTCQKTTTDQEKEEKCLVDMVMKGQTKWKLFAEGCFHADNV